MALLWWVDSACSGAENMRRDRALLERAAERGEPVLRVYAWDPPAVSLGFHQSDEELDLQALQSRGLDCVRRPTGGAAVLHHEEITYAVAGPLGLPGLGRAVMEIHDGIAVALRASLRDLGVDARAGGDGRPEGFVCFSAVGGHEISVAGRKLCGSALRRSRQGFLQHGSLLTGPGHLELVSVMRGVADAELERARLARRTVTLAELGAGAITAEAFATSFARALATRLSIESRRIEDASPWIALSEAQTGADGQGQSLR